MDSALPTFTPGVPVFRQQVKQVQLGSSFLASEAKDLLYGLGRGSGELTLRVDWPSGRVDLYENVARNALFTAVEGQGKSPS